MRYFLAIVICVSLSLFAEAAEKKVKTVKTVKTVKKVKKVVKCYDCTSHNPHCGVDVSIPWKDAVVSTDCPLTSTCFVRVAQDGVIHRGCFDGWKDSEVVNDYRGCRKQKAGWMKESVWCLCDTDHCNNHAPVKKVDPKIEKFSEKFEEETGEKPIEEFGEWSMDLWHYDLPWSSHAMAENDIMYADTFRGMDVYNVGHHQMRPAASEEEETEAEEEEKEALIPDWVNRVSHPVAFQASEIKDEPVEKEEPEVEVLSRAAALTVAEKPAEKPAKADVKSPKTSMKPSENFKCFDCNSDSPLCREKVTMQYAHWLSAMPCDQTKKCFIRQQGNKTTRGCADGWIDAELKMSYDGCEDQMYNGEKTLWCFCSTSLCNSGTVSAVKNMRPGKPGPPKPITT